MNHTTKKRLKNKMNRKINHKLKYRKNQEIMKLIKMMKVMVKQNQIIQIGFKMQN